MLQLKRVQEALALAAGPPRLRPVHAQRRQPHERHPCRAVEPPRRAIVCSGVRNLVVHVVHSGSSPPAPAHACSLGGCWGVFAVAEGGVYRRIQLPPVCFEALYAPCHVMPARHRLPRTPAQGLSQCRTHPRPLAGMGRVTTGRVQAHCSAEAANTGDASARWHARTHAGGCTWNVARVSSRSILPLVARTAPPASSTEKKELQAPTVLEADQIEDYLEPYPGVSHSFGFRYQNN